MKKIISLVVLVSSIHMHAMEQKGVLPQQGNNKKETAEELLQKAMQMMAEQKLNEQKAQQQKEEMKQQEEGDLKIAFFNFMNALATQAAKTSKKAKDVMNDLMTDVYKDSKPCSLQNNVNEVMATAKTTWTEFKTWLETDEKVEEKSEDSVVSLAGLTNDQVELIKSIITQSQKE